MAERKHKNDDGQHARHAAAIEAAREDAHAAVDERHDRSRALASVPQKVIDANEAAALATVTGNKPPRDTSEAPEADPSILGPNKNGDTHTPEEQAALDAGDADTSDDDSKGDKA